MSIKQNRNAQSPAEFIIVVFLFLIILISVFTTFMTKLRPEIEKVVEQKACLKASGLATYVLKEPGSPSAWTPANIQIFGLTNGTDDIISYDKWLAAQGAGNAVISRKVVPDTSFLLGYSIYAFKPDVADTCQAVNGTVICRTGTVIHITSISASQATLNLKLFFPFSTAAATTGTRESDDTVTTSSSSGTTMTIALHTSASDSDTFDISLSAYPRLAFIQEADHKTSGGVSLPIFIGNTSAVESFGSATTGVNNYCEAERGADILGKSNELFPARFSILAW
ncbi:MAG: hypothetical protein V1839_01195 [archaeon]